MLVPVCCYCFYSYSKDQPCKCGRKMTSEDVREQLAEKDKIIEKLRECLESYASLPDGKYYGRDDIYENLAEGARQCLAEIEME